jgi:cytoskeletal protein CcmA (bactofilin family)
MLEVKSKRPDQKHQSASTAKLKRSDTRPVKHERRRFVPTAVTNEPRDFQSKLPVITGEVHFKGAISVDGSISGNVGSSNALSLKQRPSGSFSANPELTGEFRFKAMVRVNGHIAGTVFSQQGTLIVDTQARVDANVNVAVAVINGTVKGEIVARERVELGPASKIYGKIWTQTLSIKDGAVFEGLCRMIDERTSEC